MNPEMGKADRTGNKRSRTKQEPGGRMFKQRWSSLYSFVSLMRLVAGVRKKGCLNAISERRIGTWLIAITLLFSINLVCTSQSEGNEQTKPGEYQYKLIMSKDDKVCRHMVEIYNGDLVKYGYEKYNAHQEFNAITWKESIRSVRQERDKKIYRLMKAAYFDINNDGKKELVIKDTNLLHGYDADSMWVFPDAPSDLKEISVSELRVAENKISPIGTCYNLTQIEKAPTKYQEFGGKQLYWCEGVTFLQPFVFDKVSYISFRGLHEKQPDWRKFHVIGKYKQGRLVDREEQSGVIEDICYLEKVRATN